MLMNISGDTPGEISES